MKKLTLLLAAAMLSSMSFAAWQRVTTVAELLEGGTMIIGYEATAKSGVIVPMRTEGTATTSKAGYMYSGTTAGSSKGGTLKIDTLSETAAAYEVTVVPSESVTGAVCIKIGDNFLGNTNTQNNCKLFTEESATTAFTPTVGTNDVFTLKIAANTGNTTNYTTLQYNSGSPRFAVYGGAQKNVVIYKKVADVSATAIALNATTWTAEQYKSTKLTATLTPAEATTEVVWTSSDENVATVVNGKVTAVGVGTATITATAGVGVEATCAVTVTAPTILTCDSAKILALSVGANNEVVANGKFVVRGYVTEVAYAYSASSGNLSVWLADTKTGKNTIEAYKTVPVSEVEKSLAIGDYVEVVGDLTRYNTIPELAAGCSIKKLANPTTAIDNTTLRTPSVKTIENGQLVIIRDGVKYNTMGVKLQ